MKDLHGVYKKARWFAYSMIEPELREDFAQFVAVEYLASKRDNLKWLFIDFMRSYYGATRSIKNQYRRRGEGSSIHLDAIISQDGENEILVHELVGFPDDMTDFENHMLLKYLPPKDRTVLRYLLEGRSQRWIANETGVTEGRVSQVISGIKNRLKKILK